MDTSTTNSARRTEDIALDLLKFVAAHTHVARTASTATPGFAPSTSTRPDDQVTSLLDLYARCREAVETPTKK